MRFDMFKTIGSIECTNTPQISKIHPNKESPTNDIGVGDKTPITRIKGIVSIVAHHEVMSFRHPTNDTLYGVIALISVSKVICARNKGGSLVIHD
jgi:hypothetical protein